jgi:hypothetical protein
MMGPRWYWTLGTTGMHRGVGLESEAADENVDGGYK